MKSRSTIVTLIWITVLLSVVVRFRARTTSSELEQYHVDEVYWIGSTYYYALAWSERDWTHSDWLLLPARENPPLGKYVMGAWLSWRGTPVTKIDLLGSFYLQSRIEQPHLWGPEQDDPKRAGVVARASPDTIKQVQRSGGEVKLDPQVLRSGRELSLLLGLVATVGVFFIGYVTKDAFTGFISAAIFGHHPFFVLAYKRAMIDAVSITFSIYAVLAYSILLSRLARCQRGRRQWATWMLAVATMVLVAMACGSKMNSLTIVGVLLAVTAFCGGEWRTGAATRLWDAFCRSGKDSHIIALIIGKPNLETSLAGTARLVANPRASLFRSRCEPIAIWGGAILGGAFFLFFVLNPALLQDPWGGLVALFEEHRITGQRQSLYVGSPLETPFERWPVVFDRLIWNPLWNVVLYAAIVWHIVLVLRQNDKSVIVLVWWLVSLGMLLAWIPFNWPRYILPIIPPTALILGRAYSDLIVFAWSRLYSCVSGVLHNRPV